MDRGYFPALAIASVLFFLAQPASALDINLMFPAELDQTITDAAGNIFTVHIPTATKIGTITFTPAAPPPPAISPDGSIIYGGNAGSLTTSEGTWTFGAQVQDGVDWYTQLNGSQNGWGFQMQITNGKLYTINKANGNWYLRQNHYWVDAGTTAPVELPPPPPPPPPVSH